VGSTSGGGVQRSGDQTNVLRPRFSPADSPIAGGALESAELTLTAADGNRFTAFLARAAEPTGAGISSCRTFAACTPTTRSSPCDSPSAVSTRSRSIGSGEPRVSVGARRAFDYMPHVNASTWAGHSADLARRPPTSAPSTEPRPTSSPSDFCFGGRTSFLAATLGLHLAASSAFMAHPSGLAGADRPNPLRSRIESPRRCSDSLAAQTRPSRPKPSPPSRPLFRSSGLTTAWSSTRARRTASSTGRRRLREASEQAWAEVLAFIDGHRSTRSGAAAG